MLVGMDQGLSASGEVKAVNDTRASTIVTPILKKAAPIAGVYAFSVCSGVLNDYLLSTMGVNKLAASAVVASMSKLLVSPISALLNQDAVFIANEFKKITHFPQNTETVVFNEDQEKIGVILRQGWLLAICTSIPMMLVAFNAKSILIFFGQSEEIASSAQEFFTPYGISIPIKQLLNINQRFLYAVDQEKWLMPYTMLTTCAHIGLSLLLIPRFGMSGAGIAVLINDSLSLLISTLFLKCKKEFDRFKLFSCRRHTHGRYYGVILKQGTPLALADIALFGSNFSLILYIGRLGPLRLAIEQTVIQYYKLLVSFSLGIDEATNQLIAQKMGTREFKIARRIGYTGLALTLGTHIGFDLIYNSVPLQISRLFLGEEQIAESSDIIRYTFILFAISKLLSGIQDSCAQSLSGMQDTFFASAALLISTIALILPLSTISAFLTNFDIYGINGSMLIGTSSAAALTFWHWHKTSKFAVEKESFDATKDTSNAKFHTLIFSRFFQCFNKENKEHEALDLDVVDVKDEGIVDETPDATIKLSHTVFHERDLFYQSIP